MSSNLRLRRICENCGKEFEARTTVTRTCSDSCAKRLYKAKKRTEKVEASNQSTKKAIERPIEQIRTKDYLSIQDTCKLIGVSRWTLWRAIMSQRLNAIKLGRRTVLRRSDIDRLFEVPLPILQPARVDYSLHECYTISEVLQKYGISDKALHELIKRNEIPKQRQGKFVYVPKNLIDGLF